MAKKKVDKLDPLGIFKGFGKINSNKKKKDASVPVNQPLKIYWAPNPGPQTAVLMRGETEVGYGGARGGGKTDAGLAWVGCDKQYVENPLYRGLVLRKNYDDLCDWIDRAKIFYRPFNVQVVGNPAEIRYPSGAMIRTGHLKEEDAFEKYVGHEYQKILFEELNLVPSESLYEKVLGSNRSTVDGLPAQTFCTFNPGGEGHVWVKARFVDLAYCKTYWYADGHKSRIFVPAKVQDNPKLMLKDPGYIHYLNSIKDEKLRRAWLDGDWNTFSGQFFDIWNYDKHTEDGFVIPGGWAKFRAIDWGYTAPACCLWIAVDYKGTHHVYRELYEAGNTPGGFSNKIKRMTPDNESIISTFADPSIWAKNQYGSGKFNEQETEKSIYDMLLEDGVFCTKANNDRLSGWNNLRELMYYDANLEPKVKIFKNCVNLIRTIPALIHDDKKVEDVNTHSEDHAADAFRYGCMHTFYKQEVKELSKTRIDEIIERITQTEYQEYVSPEMQARIMTTGGWSSL